MVPCNVIERVVMCEVPGSVAQYESSKKSDEGKGPRKCSKCEE